MSYCKQCFAYEVEYIHPTLGAVCLLCLTPSKSKKANIHPLGRASYKYNHIKYKEERLWKRNTLIEELEKRDNCIGCRVCHSTNRLTIDHIIPKSKKGQNIMSNKQVLCTKCNEMKKDLPPGDNGWWPDELIEYLNSFSAGFC